MMTISGSIEAECSDVEIIFMHPKGSDEFSSNKSFRWPIRENRCFVLFEHILCIMNNIYIYSSNTHWSFA